VTSGYTNFPKKSRAQLKFLGAKTVRRRKFHTEELLKICDTKKKFIVTRTTWRGWFVHSCC